MRVQTITFEKFSKRITQIYRGRTFIFEFNGELENRKTRIRDGLVFKLEFAWISSVVCSSYEGSAITIAFSVNVLVALTIQNVISF